jgi:hypothetical protein
LKRSQRKDNGPTKQKDGAREGDEGAANSEVTGKAIGCVLQGRARHLQLPTHLAGSWSWCEPLLLRNVAVLHRRVVQHHFFLCHSWIDLGISTEPRLNCYVGFLRGRARTLEVTLVLCVLLACQRMTAALMLLYAVKYFCTVDRSIGCGDSNVPKIKTSEVICAMMTSLSDR